MTVKIRTDSLYQFGDPVFDENQEEYVWGICDPPDPVERDDDQFYTLREGERIDLLAHKLLGNARYFWIILHYNNIQNSLDIENFIGEEIRLPSRATVERIYTNVVQRSDSSSDNG